MIFIFLQSNMNALFKMIDDLKQMTTSYRNELEKKYPYPTCN